MLVQTSQGQSGSAHVVVLGNEKGGSGKSTTALHIAVALMKAGQRVASIDSIAASKALPATSTTAAPGRAAPGSIWNSRALLRQAWQTMQIADNETSEFQQFMNAVSAIERTFDFIVIDTPGSDSYLMRLAHSMADTLVTPIKRQLPRFRRAGDGRPRDLCRDRRKPLCGDGARHPAQAPPTRRRLYRLDRGPQPIVDDWIAQQAARRRRPQTSCRSGSASARSMVLPERVFTASFSPRPDCARRHRRNNPWHPSRAWAT